MIPVLYDHQENLKNSVREAFYVHKNVLMQGATGIGKTQISASIVKGAFLKGKSIWFTVPRIELLKQVSNTMRSWGVPHSFIAAGLPFKEKSKVNVVSLQSLKNRYQNLTPPEFCIIDESHVGGASMDALVRWLRERGSYVLLLSATPARTDNYGMGDWADTMVQGPSVRWLIDNKYLSEYALVQPSVKMPKGCLGGDPVDEWKKHAGERLTVTYCRDKAHGYATAQLFTRNGVPASFMEANTPKEERKKIIQAFADGEIKMIVNVQLLSLGFDLASQIGRKVNVRCMLDLQPTGSLTTQLQKNGRALRYDGAGHAVIIDLAGNSYHENHGLPCADREWVLDSCDVRKRDVEYRERTLSLITCKSCYKPSKIGNTHCPYCNTRFVVDGKKIKEVDGRLVVVTPEMLRAEQEAEAKLAKTKRQEQGQARTLADLQRIAKERGYKKAWVWKQAQIKGIKT